MTSVTKTKPASLATILDEQSSAGFARNDALAAKARENIESIVKPLQEQAKQATAHLRQGYEELQKLQQDNAEAVISSTTSAARGAELLIKEISTATQASIDRSIESGRALLAARSWREIIELQADFASNSLTAYVRHADHLQSLTSQIGEEVFAPLKARFHASLSRFAPPPPAASMPSAAPTAPTPTSGIPA